MVEILGLIQAYPQASIIVISLVVSFFISLVNYFVLDKDRVREIKSRQKAMQQEIMKHQKEGNHEKALALQKETLTDTMDLMRHSFKPVLITMIPALIVYALLKGAYATTSLASTWVWYYIITAIVGGMIFRKILNLP